MRNIYCVIRVFPSTMFFEEWGNKKHCMNYAKKAAKPRLRVCKVVPVVEWDAHGKMKERKD